MADSAYALYLQSAERVTVIADAAQTAKWGALARQLAVSTGIATEADAQAAGALYLAFMAGPMVQVSETVIGVIDISAIKGRVVTINGLATFVLGGGEDSSRGVTVIEGLRRL